MATGTSLPASPPPAPLGADWTSAKVVQYDRYIDEQIKKTRSHVKSVEVVTAVVTLVAGTLGYLLLVTLADHWFVPGGLGWVLRSLCFATLVGGVGYFLVRHIAPLFLRRINPLYAAYTIEQTRPTFKNSLLNLLMFRADRAAVPDVVYESVERHAVHSLTHAPVDAAVDRSMLIKLGYFLIAVLAASAAYKLFSPKDPFQTVGRIVMPWSDISAPTRASIDDVRPGDVTATRGEQIDVSAEIRGLAAAESVTLYYSTSDGQEVNRAVPMVVSEGGYRHQCQLPPDKQKLLQDLTYRIVAGDATSPTYRATVESAPTIVVASVDYNYPDYTDPLLRDRVGVAVADVKALEGTRVTIHAVANQDISDAWIDFDCDGKRDQALIVAGQTAKGTFALAFKDRAHRVAEHASYQVLFSTRRGLRNEQPVRHTIAVIPDLPPEAEFLAPAKDEIEVPENGAALVSVRALDPDFKLNEVRLAAKVAGGRELPAKALLADADRPWQGQHVSQVRFIPRAHGLKPGDVIEYWAEAVDNKTPDPNRARTRAHTMRIVAPNVNNRQNKSDGGDRNDNRPDKPNDNKPNDSKPNDSKPNNDPQNGDHQDPQNKNGDSKNDAGSKPDPNSAPDGKDKNAANNDRKDGKNAKPQPNNDGNKNDGSKSDQGKSDRAKSDQGGQKNDQRPNGAQDKDGSSQDAQGAGDKGQGSGKQGAQKPKDGAGQSGDKSKRSPSGQDGIGETGDSSQGSDAGGMNDAAGSDAADGRRQTPSRERRADDAEAIEQLLKDRQQSQQGEPNKDGPSGKATPSDPKAGDPSQNAAGKDGDGKTATPKNDGAAAGDESKGADGKATDGKRADGKTGDEKNPLDSKQGAKPDARPKDQGTEGNGNDNKTEQGGSDQTGGRGGDSKPEPNANKKPGDNADKKADKKDDKSASKATPGMGQQSSSGTGKASDGKDGSPEAQGPNKTRTQPDKQDDKAGKSDGDGPQSPSNSKSQSKNSTGQSDGDKSGGGEKGGGQGANQAGKDTAGKNQSSDEGANASHEKGKGETGSDGGEGPEAKGKTGQSGDKQGDGSKTRAGTSDNGSGEKGPSEKKPADKNADKNADAKDPGGPDDKGKSSSSSKNRSDKGQRPGGSDALGHGAGQSSDRPPAANRDADPRPEAVDLENARKAADLALSHLRDKMKKGEAEPLLKKLGWTREDAENYLRAIDEMKRDAAGAGEKADAAKKNYDDYVNSLGIRSGRETVRSSDSTQDESRGYRRARASPRRRSTASG